MKVAGSLQVGSSGSGVCVVDSFCAHQMLWTTVWRSGQWASHHHQITKLSHSINAIGPAPHRSGRKREHRSIVFATITHIPSLHKIRRNAPKYHPTNPLATPSIIRNKTQQLDRCIRQCQNIACLCYVLQRCMAATPSPRDRSLDVLSMACQACADVAILSWHTSWHTWLKLVTSAGQLVPPM
jgi:hypothetical protein